MFLENGRASSDKVMVVVSLSTNSSKLFAKANLYVAEFLPKRIIARHWDSRLGSLE